MQPRGNRRVETRIRSCGNGRSQRSGRTGGAVRPGGTGPLHPRPRRDPAGAGRGAPGRRNQPCAAGGVPRGHRRARAGPDADTVQARRASTAPAISASALVGLPSDRSHPCVPAAEEVPLVSGAVLRAEGQPADGRHDRKGQPTMRARTAPGWPGAKGHRPTERPRGPEALPSSGGFPASHVTTANPRRSRGPSVSARRSGQAE